MSNQPTNLKQLGQATNQALLTQHRLTAAEADLFLAESANTPNTVASEEAKVSRLQEELAEWKDEVGYWALEVENQYNA